MRGTQYVLTGFGDFFERRRIAFVYPLPQSHVCCACGFLPSLSVRLPCGHVLCRLCKSQTASGGARCPVEGVKFEEARAVSRTVEMSDVEQLRVFCLNGDQRCAFVGQLAELPGHVRECRYDEVRCDNCDGAVARSAAVDHRRQCCVTLPLAGRTAKPAEVVVVDGGPAGVLEGVAHGDANGSSVEHATNHPADWVRAKRTSSGVLKEPVSRCVAPGPYRAASKPGVFATLCRFDKIYEKYEELRYKDTASAVVRGCVAGGYTFALKCTLAKQEGNAKVVVYFSIFLSCGEWDNCVEWPFDKAVAVILTHPKDKTKDVMLQILMVSRDAVKKPAPTGTTWNNGHRTVGCDSWERIESEGFIHKNALYVNVEFE
ncbi:uncharacterized protein LOC142559332 [Dermacentor variabilis]|uniref:uncharacterized protein LOC142559332 n=1 Tax=Dermacentor variabilis TaxID=34621 RepID=UPI003F5B10AE